MNKTMLYVTITAWALIFAAFAWIAGSYLEIISKNMWIMPQYNTGNFFVLFFG